MTAPFTSLRRLTAAVLAATLLATALPGPGVALAASGSYGACMRQAETERDPVSRANLQLLCVSDQVIDAGLRGFETAYPIVDRGACELVDRPIYGQKTCP